MKKILIVDDDVAVTNYLMVFLMQTGIFEPTIINDSREVASVLKREDFDVILLDMDMPNVSGMDILRSMREIGMETPVVVLTGVSDVDLAVNSMKLGAFDYLIKPVDDDKLIEVLNNSIEHRVLYTTIEQLPNDLTRGELTHEDAFKVFNTQNKKMIRLFHQAEKIAASDLSIFILGESGTGKEAIARAIHEASPRRDKPFIAIEADSQDPEKFPAFFFGQAKGWSGSREENPGMLEEANHGTIFLDNIDALTLPMQVRLKRVIQTGEYYRESSARILNVDVRIIVSSEHNLASPEFQDKFSHDLLYHLMVNLIKLPPLHERMDDLPLLSGVFLKQESEKVGKSVAGFTTEVIDLLGEYHFPNNVQELRSIIASAVVREETDIITMDSIPMYLKEKIELAPVEEKPFMPRKLDEVVKEHIKHTLLHFESDRDKAARKLGISIDEINRIADEME